MRVWVCLELVEGNNQEDEEDVEEVVVVVLVEGEMRWARRR
jgi:hypothetical protein